MEYKFLSEVPDKIVVDCVNLAFSDYPVRIFFTEDKLYRFFETSGVDKSMSVCAFSDAKMVGFIFNSSGIYNGNRVVFDAGTGGVPKYRGRGIFTRLYKHAEQELCKKGIVQYYLEVLQQNKRAIALYERLGFSIVRDFSVLQLSEPKLNGRDASIRVISLSEFNYEAIGKCKLVKPSFEHSQNVIMQCSDRYKAAYLTDRQDVSAFCIFDADDGRLIQLGFASLSDLKRVVLHIASLYHTVTAKNIDTSYSDVMEMLSSVGFKEASRQYEMVREYKKGVG